MTHHRSHASDYLRILYRRRWTASIAFVLVFAYGAAGSLRKAPVYEAGAQLLVDKDNPARALRSRTLVWRTLEDLGLGRPPANQDQASALDDVPDAGMVERIAVWLGAPRAMTTPVGSETVWQSKQIDAFLAGVTVAPYASSRVLTVSYRSADPVFAAKAANALAERYVEQAWTYRILSIEGGGDFESDQLREQRGMLADSQIALQRYIEAHGTPSVASREENATARKIADISADLSRARLATLDQDAVLNRWLGLRKNPDNLEAFPGVRTDDVVQKLWKEVSDIREKDGHLAAAGISRDREDRRVLAVAELKALTRLQSRIDQLMMPVRAEAEAFRDAERNAQGRYDAALAQVPQADRALVEYVVLERAAMRDREANDYLVQRAKDVAMDGARAGSVQVIEAASVPRRPILPNRGRDLGFAFSMAILIALGLAAGTEFLDSRLKNPDDVKVHLRLPFLGLVPAVSARHTRNGGLLLNRGVPPGFSEALRSVRTAVIFSSAAEGAKSLMVTSTAPGEGKTVTSTNLAMALAQADLRTLLIDADMRRPRSHEVFAIEQEPGLSNVLVGTATLAEAVRATDNPSLFVLPAGHVPPNPAELLSSPRCQRLLEDLGADYDWIVVDAPPVMAVTDAAVISHFVSGVVFVVGAEMIPRRNAQQAIEQLTQAQAKMIGVVLNRAEVERHAYYYAPYERKEYAPVDAPRL